MDVECSSEMSLSAREKIHDFATKKNTMLKATAMETLQHTSLSFSAVHFLYSPVRALPTRNKLSNLIANKHASKTFSDWWTGATNNYVLSSLHCFQSWYICVCLKCVGNAHTRCPLFRLLIMGSGTRWSTVALSTGRLNTIEGTGMTQSL
jgi:hypothetical protein